MVIRKVLLGSAALALASLAGLPALASIPSADDAPVLHLQGAILNEMAAAPADADAVSAAITRATSGWDLHVITEALCPLGRANLNSVFGGDASGIAQAQTTLARPEVRQAINDTCEVARLALASYGATGGIAAGTAPGQAFGSSGVGAPGGGGGSGYTN